MEEKEQDHWDLILLLSLLLVILIYPVMDHGDIRKSILGVLFFAPVVMATVRMSEIKSRVWPSVLLMLGTMISAVASTFFPNRVWMGIRWGMMAAFFGFTVLSLFSHLKNARSVTNPHLYTAISIYLLLGMQWFALYSVADSLYPGAVLRADSGEVQKQSELLYFSLVTLSTIGYGDIVPRHGVVRMLAALEGVTGVLYVAITVALLVNAYKQSNGSK